MEFLVRLLGPRGCREREAYQREHGKTDEHLTDTNHSNQSTTFNVFFSSFSLTQPSKPVHVNDASTIVLAMLQMAGNLFIEWKLQDIPTFDVIFTAVGRSQESLGMAITRSDRSMWFQRILMMF